MTKIKCKYSERGKIGFRGVGPRSWGYCAYDGAKVRLERCEQCKFYDGVAETMGLKDLSELTNKKDERWIQTIKVDIKEADKLKDEQIAWLNEELKNLKKDKSKGK
ncbi:MAG: hypothetical protein KAX49_11825 [Halanaerobiales bacterium]|nr:hypothetical protein [Halanaerobiales bacterium]